MTDIPATMPDQVEDAINLEISYRTLHPSAYIVDSETERTIRIPFSSVINKYKDYLSTIIIKVELSDQEQSYYHYKPKALSEEMYGTTELWDTILILNNCKSVIDFTPKVVKLYDPEKFKSYLNEVMIIEEELGNISY